MMNNDNATPVTAAVDLLNTTCPDCNIGTIIHLPEDCVNDLVCNYCGCCHERDGSRVIGFHTCDVCKRVPPTQ